MSRIGVYDLSLFFAPTLLKDIAEKCRKPH